MREREYERVRLPGHIIRPQFPWRMSENLCERIPPPTRAVSEHAVFPSTYVLGTTQNNTFW